MEIRKLLALSLSMTSTSVLAFQANDRQVHEPSGSQLRSVEERLFSQGSRQHLSGLENAFSGTCTAVPLAGCGCAFCTLLRSQQT